MSKADRIRELQLEANRLKVELAAKEKKLAEYRQRDRLFASNYIPKGIAPDTQTNTKKEAKT